MFTRNSNLLIFILCAGLVAAAIGILNFKISSSFAQAGAAEDQVRIVEIYKTANPVIGQVDDFTNATALSGLINPSANEANSAAPSSSLKFLFVGDLMLDRQVGVKIKSAGLDSLLKNLAAADFFSGYDIVSGNLEGAVTNNGRHYAPVYQNDFAFSSTTIGQLKKYNFNFFNLANNHITDQGSTGLTETRQNLAAAGFNYSGAADAAVDDYSTWTLDINGQKIGMIGLSMVYRQFDLEQAKKLVTATKAQTDKVIINIHWGNEYQPKFNQQQAEIARALIDSGADAIIGHHPHVVEGMEIYKSKPIFYSLGNFIFDQYFSAATQQGLAVGLNFTAPATEISLFPLQSQKSAVSLMGVKEKNKFFDKFIEWSKVDAKLAAQIKESEIIIK
jgi:poly-gamma-glutamate synthesis protein (capsule biosynthesis protein)